MEALIQENLLLKQRINELESLLKTLTTNNLNSSNSSSNDSINSIDSVDNTKNTSSQKKLVPPTNIKLKYQDDDYFYWI
jgi:hypothetical protein